jgi:hypothetical protein
MVIWLTKNLAAKRTANGSARSVRANTPAKTSLSKANSITKKPSTLAGTAAAKKTMARGRTTGSSRR